MQRNISIIILMLALETMFVQHSYAQWSYLGLGGKRIAELRSKNGFLYTATHAGAFRKQTQSSDTVWTSLGLTSKRVFSLLVFNDSTFIAAVYITGMGNDTTSLYKTTNAGGHWFEYQNGYGHGEGSNQVLAMEMKDSQPDILFASGAAVLSKSTDVGASWYKVYGDFHQIGMGVHFIKFHEIQSTIMWSGGESAMFSPYLLKSTTSGESWLSIPMNTGGDNACYSIATDSLNTNIVYTGMEGRVMKTTDGGSNWTTVLAPSIYPYFYGLTLSRNLNLYAAGAVNTNDPQALILYKSSDGGSTWSTRSTGDMGNKGVTSLLVSGNSDVDSIFLGTTGDGVFRYRNPVVNSTKLVRITTNPCCGTIIIDGNLRGPGTYAWGRGSEHTLDVISPNIWGSTRYVFNTWSDGGAKSHTVTISANDTTFTANFTTQYQLTITSNSIEGGIIVPSSGQYWNDSGNTVQLTAIPDSGYLFMGWKGDVADTTNPISITMDSPKSVVAYFRESESSFRFLSAGWSLVSVSRIQSNYAASKIFPSKYGDMFAYSSGSYVTAPTLEIGHGYWIYYTTDSTIIIPGSVVSSPIQVDCQAGWNLVGSREVEVATTALTTEPAGQIFGSIFRYDNFSGSYLQSSVLTPVEGVWVYMIGPCTLTIP